MKHRLFRTYGITFVFIGTILFPLLNGRLTILTDIESFENRSMAKEPTFDVKHLDGFPQKYDSYYNDSFNLRNRLISYFNFYNISTFQKAPGSSAVIGENDWLYLKGDEMDSYTGAHRFTKDESESFRLELEYRKKYLGDKGIKLYFMPIPCKASVYGEYIGYEYYRMHTDTWGEQLNAYLAKNSEVKPIQIFETLRKEKEKTNLFFKLDNHWNSLGAFYAANAAIEHMRTDFPELTPLSIDDYTLKSSISHEGNTQKMLGNLDVFTEINIQLLPKHETLSVEAPKANHTPVHGFAYPDEYEMVREIKNSKKPKLLIISDSFGSFIFPFLAENFSKTVKIFDSWQYKLNQEIVEIEKPDIVLIMIDEPILRNLLEFQSRSPKK